MTAAACVPEPVAPSAPARDQLLDQAFSLVASDPAWAARLFAEAGEGTVLETARMESWADCLERSSAASGAWREYLRADPPPSSTARARLQLIAVLITEGDFAGAAAERLLLDDDSGPAADELLLSAGDDGIRLSAARRLTVTAPGRLSSFDKDLDRSLLAGLGPEERLQRSRAWRREGSPSRAAAELRSGRWSGAAEIERRRELAQAELDAGSPNKALRVLPDGRDAGSADLTLRAQALRNRAWYLWPGGSSRKVFDECRSAAARALAIDTSGENRATALALHLECATESDRLDAAFDSWRELEATGWDDGRREWLGRRLGVALAIRGGDPGRVFEIAGALPAQDPVSEVLGRVGRGIGGPRSRGDRRGAGARSLREVVGRGARPHRTPRHSSGSRRWRPPNHPPRCSGCWTSAPKRRPHASGGASAGPGNLPPAKRSPAPTSPPGWASSTTRSPGFALDSRSSGPST